MPPLEDLARFPGHSLGEQSEQHEVVWSGKFLKWKVHQFTSRVKVGGRRGEVQGFSRQSRLRLLSYLATLQWETLTPCLFVTLTYPDETTTLDNYSTGMHRARFWREVETHLGHHVPGLWRIEWMQRKSGACKGQAKPHFHILVFREKFIHKDVVNDAWRAIHKVDYIRTEVKRRRSEREAAGYVAKYCAKTSNCSLVNDAYHNKIPHGRQWGVLRKNLIPTHEKKKVLLPRSDKVQAARIYAHEGREVYNKYGNESFTLLGDMAEIIGEFIFGEGIDEYGEICENA